MLKQLAIFRRFICTKIDDVKVSIGKNTYICKAYRAIRPNVSEYKIL